MDKIVDALFVFRGQGVVENFPGNYSDFRAYEDSKPKESSVKKEVEKKEVFEAGYHEHVELLNGLAKQAAKYPHWFM